MRDCAKHFLIVSPIAPISSRPAPTPIASDAASSGRRKNSTDESVQMTRSGKPGKRESCFPPFPLLLEIPEGGIPTFTQLRLFLSCSNQTLTPPGPTFAGKGGPDLVDIRTPVPCGAAGCFGQARMSCEDVRQTFFPQHGNCLAQAIQKVR